MNENEFGYRIRQALNEGAEHLDYRTSLRLESDAPAGWAQRLGLAAPLLALIVGFVAIYDWQQERRISELADMDFAVLLDDAPIGTYADKGFGTLLQTGTDEL
jgi:Protein of unknown function (DUF3619)